MQTMVSTKGQVVLPHAARQKLGIRPGTKLTCRIQGRSLVLTPQGGTTARTRLVRDKVTGLVITVGGPSVTSEQVRAGLADFP